MALKTRQPTGKPPWPLVLIAGREKAGKSYTCAAASASEHIGRTLWIGIGEDDPDEYSQIPGARFEIVEHGGTFPEVLESVKDAVAEPSDPARPNLIVVDSMSQLWELITDDLQATADKRERNKGQITMDLWNRGYSRWRQVMDALRRHNGPVLLTSRLEQVTVMKNGKPTTEKQEKIKSHKSLPFDVGVIVEFIERGQAAITGARSLRIDVPLGQRVPVPNFTIEALWKQMGVTEQGGTTPRAHAETVATEVPDGQDVEDPDWAVLIHEAGGNVEALRRLWQDASKAGADKAVLDKIKGAAEKAQESGADA